jgi:hypothetical protein
MGQPRTVRFIPANAASPDLGKQPLEVRLGPSAHVRP